MRKIDFVDTIIGTVGDEQEQSFHGGGKTHPGACTPGGMVQVSPDTFSGGDNGTGYNYCNDTIEGFSLNHMSGIGWYGDLGNLQIMPIVGETDLRSGSNTEVPFKKGTVGWKSQFSHESEITKAGYYAVRLDRYDIYVEATALEHCGLLKISYPENSKNGLIFNFFRRIAGHADFESVKIVSGSRIEGYIVCTPKGGGFGRGAGNISYNLYFVCEFSHPIKEYKFFSDEEYIEEKVTEYENEDVGLLVRFEESIDTPITVKCGISYTDLEGAKKNFAAECESIDFEKAKKKTESKWEEAFDCVEVEGTDNTDLTLFYTCLYHALLDPRILTDTDGRARMGNGTIIETNYTHRTMFSGWDVYRSEFPLLTVIKPDIVNEEVNSLITLSEIYNSAFPKWELLGNDSGCMIGDSGLLVVADAYLKGISDFDVKKAYATALAACKASQEFHGKPFNSLRPNNSQYLKDAYIAGNLSETLEFLLADFAMSRFCLAMNDADNAEYFFSRAKKYKENFNEKTGFMGPKDENGKFIEVKDEYDDTGCTESNIYQQSWFAPYDVTGLAELFGKERAVELLEKLFSKADLSAMWNVNYNHSNEPCHNLTHYFNELGLPKRTQYWTRRVQKEAYRLGAFGFCGNEDVGQISGWYVLSALGFAQTCIADNRFSVNTPLFKTATVKLNSKYHKCSVSEYFKIRCDKDPLSFPYIKEIYLNGQKIDRYYLTYQEITAGGVLEFILEKN